MKPSTSLLLGIFVLFLAAPRLFAQSASISAPLPPAASTGQPAALSPTEQWIRQLKNPTPWIAWGGDLRIRDEYFDNILSLSEADPLHEQNVIRIRARLWTTVTPVTNVALNVRLSAEPREWTKPAFAGAYRGQSGMEWRYGMIDNLNVKWANAFDLPLTITAGRQDLIIGDFWNWWLVADGSPGDGSWTYFLDAVRATYEAKDLKTKFDVSYIYQNARPDAWLPTLNAHPDAYPLTEQNEQGVIAYVSNRSLPSTSLEGFFIYKRDNQELANGDNANIYTLGGRVTGLPHPHVQYSIEGAYQFGEKQDPTVRTPVNLGNLTGDLDAFAANTRLSYLFKDALDDQAHLVFEYMSGDDPDSQGRDEMFDVLWGRWPRYSELYIYSYVQETSGKVAQHNNLMRAGVGWTLVPFKRTSLGAYYNALFAPEEVPTRTINGARFSQDGSFRGHYVQAVLQHTFSKRLKGHLWAEFLWEGDYYAQRDLMTFLRAEFTLSF